MQVKKLGFLVLNISVSQDLEDRVPMLALALALRTLSHLLILHLLLSFN